ncbi:MAG TPA: hypothetical protein VD931_17320 [Baekduia sp.]|nr:hypothetical protein [Baekduia sp.]
MDLITILAADIGAKSLLLLYLWLGSAIAASEIAKRKGYAEKTGLGTGMVLPVIAPIVWLLVPKKKLPGGS